MWTAQTLGAGVALLLLCVLSLPATAQLRWRPRDAFDVIQDRIKAVTPKNCAKLPEHKLKLPMETVGQIPRPFNDSRNRSWDQRSSLLNLHNQALTRSFAYSYLYQTLDKFSDFFRQPGWMHFYFSAGSSVSSGHGTVASSMNAFDYNYTYANWMKNLYFNRTLPLFAPHAYLMNEREVHLRDEGVFTYGNYSDPGTRLNDWYKLWLPDSDSSTDYLHKQTYNISIMADGQWFNKTIYGPRIPWQGSQHRGVDPVKFTRPWFDCDGSNRWLVSAAAPIVDLVPRYLAWTHLRRYRFVAVSVAEADLSSLDINQCPLSHSNPGPNLLANTSRCKNTTTVCQPVPGFGFRRGGYQCACKPGYRLPPGQHGPFKGLAIENATKEEYEKGFNCIKIKGIRKVSSEFVKNVFKPRDRGSNIWGQRRRRNFYTTTEIEQSPTPTNNRTSNTTVVLRAALRTSHFLSNLMQNANNGSSVNDTREDSLPDEDIIVAEVIALALANSGIRGAGIYYDENAFRSHHNISRRFFAPYARFSQPGNVTVRDESFRNASYTKEPWFAFLKMRWENNVDKLTRFRSNIRVRSDIYGKEERTYPRSPLYFRGPGENDGMWFRDRNSSMVYSLVYSTPFFGLSDNPHKAEFRGVVKLDMFM